MVNIFWYMKFSFGNFGNFWKNQSFFRAATAGLGKYHPPSITLRPWPRITKLPLWLPLSLGLPSIQLERIDPSHSFCYSSKSKKRTKKTNLNPKKLRLPTPQVPKGATSKEDTTLAPNSNPATEPTTEPLLTPTALTWSQNAKRATKNPFIINLMGQYKAIWRSDPPVLMDLQRHYPTLEVEARNSMHSQIPKVQAMQRQTRDRPMPTKMCSSTGSQNKVRQLTGPSSGLEHAMPKANGSGQDHCGYIGNPAQTATSETNPSQISRLSALTRSQCSPHKDSVQCQTPNQSNETCPCPERSSGNGQGHRPCPNLEQSSTNSSDHQQIQSSSQGSQQKESEKGQEERVAQIQARGCTSSPQSCTRDNLTSPSEHNSTPFPHIKKYRKPQQPMSQICPHPQLCALRESLLNQRPQ